MNTNIIVCQNCGTENERDFLYCKRCGAKLNIFENAKPDFEPATEPEDCPAFIDGIPTAEIADYVGPNAEKYIPKFQKHSRGGKVGWNIPVFLFGLLLNLPFVWFFRRKLYKFGAILLAVTLTLTVVSGVLMFGLLDSFKPYYNDFVESLEQLETFDASQFATYDEYLEAYAEDVSIIVEEYITNAMTDRRFNFYGTLLNGITYLKIGIAVLCALFADHIYYKKAMNDIHTLNASSENGFPSAEVVMSAGGVNKKLSVLLGILSGVLTIAAYAVPLIMFIVSAITTITL